MWPKVLQNLLGSKDRELALLREQNDLLRLQLQQQGVKRLPSRPPGPKQPRRTENDIIVVTREMLWEKQMREKAEKQRSWGEPPPGNGNPTGPQSADAPATNAPNGSESTKTPQLSPSETN